MPENRYNRIGYKKFRKTWITNSSIICNNKLHKQKAYFF